MTAFHPGKGFDDMLGVKSARLFLESEGEFLFPLSDFCEPGRALFEFRSGIHGVKDFAYIGKDPQVGKFIFIDLRVIYIHMDDFRVSGKLFSVAGNSVIKTGAERDKKVAFVCGVVRPDCAVHSKPPE